MVYIIASTRRWNKSLVKELEEKTGLEFIYLNSKDELNYEKLKEIEPKYIFFPHWSYIIPEKIYSNFNCVIFHMTDLPYGRGGSPLQNLIARGIYETKITALKCLGEIDAGPVYMKKPFSLFGSAEEIYLRASNIVKDMIIEIIENEPVPVEQQGNITNFIRKKPNESDIQHLSELIEIFDYIRMLDAEGYPKAFMETEKFRFEFSRASLKYDRIIADVEIFMKNKD